jgi:hypothetical protein
MKKESLARILAGSVTLLGTILAWQISPWWMLLTAFVSLNLIQSAVTGFCPPIVILSKLGWVDDRGIIHWGGVR